MMMPSMEVSHNSLVWNQENGTPKLSHFDGVDPKNWLLAADRYFNFYEIDEADRFQAVAEYMEGAAFLFFEWIWTYFGHISWSFFKGVLIERFKDFQRANSSLPVVSSLHTSSDGEINRSKQTEEGIEVRRGETSNSEERIVRGIEESKMEALTEDSEVPITMDEVLIRRAQAHRKGRRQKTRMKKRNWDRNLQAETRTHPPRFQETERRLKQRKLYRLKRKRRRRVKDKKRRTKYNAPANFPIPCLTSAVPTSKMLTKKRRESRDSTTVQVVSFWRTQGNKKKRRLMATKRWKRKKRARRIKPDILPSAPNVPKLNQIPNSGNRMEKSSEIAIPKICSAMCWEEQATQIRFVEGSMSDYENSIRDSVDIHVVVPSLPDEKDALSAAKIRLQISKPFLHRMVIEMLLKRYEEWRRRARGILKEVEEIVNLQIVGNDLMDALILNIDQLITSVERVVADGFSLGFNYPETSSCKLLIQQCSGAPK